MISRVSNSLPCLHFTVVMLSNFHMCSLRVAGQIRYFKACACLITQKAKFLKVFPGNELANGKELGPGGEKV